MKTCSMCNIQKDKSLFYKNRLSKDGLDTRCSDCAKKYQKEYRLKNPEKLAKLEKKRDTENKERIKKHRERNRLYREKNQRIRKAIGAVNDAIRYGKLIKPDSCSICFSSGRIEGHHDDYAKPLEVRWLCRTCHARWHANNEPLNKG